MSDRARYSYRHNLTVPGAVRDELRDGIKFLVVPVVMLKEQVLHCSNCHPEGEFISGEEIAASAPAWDNRPVTLRHPTEPWTPSNHQRLEVGRIFNVRWDGSRLRGEMWLNILKLRDSMEGRVAEDRFRKGEVTEISTGYFVERQVRNGRHEGKKYVIEQRGLIPDHLAILTDEVGACSVEGGCGAPRLNTNGGDEPVDETKKLLARIADFLMGRPAEGDQSTEGDEGDGEVAGENVDSVENQDGGESSASTTGEQGEGGSGEGKETDDGSGSSMDEKQKKDLVARLLSSGKVVGFDEKQLTNMTDEQLTALAKLAGCGCAEGGPSNNAEGDGGDEADDGGQQGADEGDSVSFTREDAEFVAQLRTLSGGSVDGLRSLIDAGKAEAERRGAAKAELVKRLNADDRVSMSKAVLESMSLEALEGFDRSLNPLSYAGRSGPRIDNEGGDDGFAPDAPLVALAAAEKED